MSMKLFYVGVKAVIRNDNDQLLLLKDSSKKDFWDVPGGRIDENETIEQALLRELSEELPSHGDVTIGNLLHAFRVPGSIYKDIGLTLLFYEVKIDLPKDIKLSHEHTEHAWLDLTEADKIASSGVVSLIKEIS